MYIVSKLRPFAAAIAVAAIAACPLRGETVEPIAFGNMDSWIVRNVKESIIIGGELKTLYAIGPSGTIDGPEAYVPADGNPWASSNVLANVCGVVKTSNAVSPGDRPGHGKCAVLSTKIEHCKAVGIVNINVLVCGSVFLGRMMEPIRSTSNPYSKMEMGVPFKKRPAYLQFDYRLSNPNSGKLTSANGRSIKTYPGADAAEVFIILQERWEDKDGNLFARRVGTGRARYAKPTSGWVEKCRVKVNYGDISRQSWYKDYMGLIPADRSYYARNSKGKMVPVKEVGWAPADARPTHLLVMASSGCGTAYVGTLGMEFSIDNVALVY